MRSLALLCLLSTSAWGASYYEDTLALTSTPPVVTASPTPCGVGAACALSIYTATTMRVTVCAEEGQTLSGAGRVRLYLWVPGISGTGLWANNRGIDLLIPATTDTRCVPFDRNEGVPKGYVLPVTDGITVSGGATVTVRIDLGYAP